MTVKMDEKNKGSYTWRVVHPRISAGRIIQWRLNQTVEIAMPRHISGNSSRKLYVPDRSCPPGTDNIGFLGERLSYGMSCSSGLFQMRIWDRRCQRFEVRNSMKLSSDPNMPLNNASSLARRIIRQSIYT